MLLPEWPGEGQSWETQSSGFVDYTLDPQIPDGSMPTPACELARAREAAPQRSARGRAGQVMHAPVGAHGALKHL